jgi:hypothetical protein
MKTVVTTGSSTSVSEIIEAVITKGDLAQLTAQERTRYYVEVCKSVGLNPLTKPFEYIMLNGKMTLYALRNATDQLRAIHGVSVEELTETERDGVFIVTAKVRNRDGRTDVAKGAVSISNLKGDALANALMRGESKAKRRATLSLCGLGFLDESELDTVPAAVIARPAPVLVNQPAVISGVAAPAKAEPPHDPKTGEIGPRAIALPPAKTEWQRFIWWGSAFIAAIGTATTQSEIEEWQKHNAAMLDSLRQNAPKIYDRIVPHVEAASAKLAGEATSAKLAKLAREAGHRESGDGVPPFLDRRKNGGPRLVPDNEDEKN